MKNINQKETIIKKLNGAFDFLVSNPYSTFYKDKYQRAGIKLKSIKTLEEFQSLPYLTKDEILSVSPYDFIFTNPKSISDVGITSGTTNKDTPLLLLSDINIRPSINIDRFNPLIDRKVRSHMLLYAPMTAAARLRRNEDLIRKGIINTVGDLGNLSLTAKIIRRLQIESIETTASILYLFIPHLKKEYDLNKIKVIMIGGEYCSEQKYKFLKKTFKNAHFIVDFGSVETGTMGYRCQNISKMPTRFFHPSNHVFIEVIGEKEEGELVVTGIKKGKIPYFLRYRTGNHVKLTDSKCKCGNNKLLEIFGKIGLDVFPVQGTFIYSNQIFELLSPYWKYFKTTDFKLHVYEVIIGNKIMIKLILQLMSKTNFRNPDKVKKQIRERINNLVLTPQNTLSGLVEKGVYMPLEIEFVKEFPLTAKRTSIISHII